MKPHSSICSVTARTLIAVLFVISIATVTRSSVYAEADGALAAQQNVGGTGAPVGSDLLRMLVDEALSHSPMVLSARSHWQALTKVPIQAATLPDPQVSFQQFTVGSPQPASGYETSDFYYTGFGVSQDIPGPGKLRLQKAQAEKDAEYGENRYEAARRDIEEKVKEIYFELFYHAKTLAILDRNQEELQPDPADRRNPVSRGPRPAAGPDQGAASNHGNPEGACDAPSGGRPGTA